MNYIPFHEIDENPQSNDHLAEIIESIRQNGWVGLPLLADGDNLLNGCHRAAACRMLGVQPVVHQMQISCTWGEGEYSDMLLRDLAESNGTEDLLRVLDALLDEGLVDKMSVDIMRAEYGKE